MSGLLEVYKKFDLDVARAEGKYIYSKDGKKYLDLFSGISVNVLGHRPCSVIKSVKETMEKYLHLSNLFKEEKQEKLAEILVERTFPGKVFFVNSGAEAVECAIKSARKYFNGDKYEVISFKNSFHGRTLAALAATGQEKFSKGLGPMPEGFIHADYNFLASAEEKINYKTCAILVEVIQGEGGVNIADKDFIQGLRKICSEKGIFLIIDEIQTGMGRTGSFMGYEHYGIKPDIAVMGKALGGGLPLSAVILNEEVSSSLKPGDHGSTFGGNPVSCAAGLAAVNAIDEEMLKSIKKSGKALVKVFKDLQKETSSIREVRGRGLMIGVELDFEAGELVKFLFDKGIITNCTAEKVLRLLPPYTVMQQDIEKVALETGKYLKEKL